MEEIKQAGNMNMPDENQENNNTAGTDQVPVSGCSDSFAEIAD